VAERILTRGQSCPLHEPAHCIWAIRADGNARLLRSVIAPSVELDIFDASIGADQYDSAKLSRLANNSPPLRLRNVDLVRGDIDRLLRGFDTVLEHVRGIVSRLD
jgi:hypothetical protein